MKIKAVGKFFTTAFWKKRRSAKLQAQRKETQRFWGSKAAAYQRAAGRIRPFVERMIVSEHLKEPVLSLASGPFSSPVSGIETDVSHTMLEMNPARKKVQFDLNSSKGKFPFRDKSFSSVTLVFGSKYLNNPKKAFLEAKRVLKPGGKLVLVDSPQSAYHSFKRARKNRLGEKGLIKVLKRCGFDVDVKHEQFQEHSFDPAELVPQSVIDFYLISATKPK